VASASGRSRSSRRLSPPGVTELLRPDSPMQLRADLGPRPGRRCRIGGRGIILLKAMCPRYEGKPNQVQPRAAGRGEVPE
jgi:hypothetical protein